jgi:phosphatidate phosphatase APP1
MPPPFPGIAALLTTLELRAGGIAGDMHYVTARLPERVVDLPDWMAMHGVPVGVIETGISGIPNIAQREKIADITRIFEARSGQKFVLFGDSSQRDPEVYAAIRTKFPDQVAATFIHKVTATVAPERVAGMFLVDNYAQAAAQAFGGELITEAEARKVMVAARDGGLAITDAEIDELIDAAR